MTPSSRPTLLVGSVNLKDAEEVLSTAGRILGSSLRSVPDGETGVRLGWYSWQEDVFKRAAFLKAVGKGGGARDGVDQFGFSRFAANRDLSGARFDKLGYADAAIESYRIFKKLCEKATLPPGIRFQVSLPTPMAPLTAMIETESYLRVEPVYEEAMREEIRQICKAIPADDLAFQWDVAMEIGILEGLKMLGGKTVFLNPMRDMVGRLVRVIGWVPENVPVGLHFCYGSYEGKHWKEPKDTGLMVELANAVLADVPRRIDWLHMPVPINRDDDAYFAPLNGLKHSKQTLLYLGLVHHTDGVEGGRRRMKTAQRYITDFGVTTECGLGRLSPEIIPDVMKLMAALAVG